MNDKSFSLALIVVFGLSGLALLAASWSLPFMHTEKVTVWIGGGIGIGFALVRGWMLRHEFSFRKKDPVRVEVHAGDGQ